MELRKMVFGLALIVTLVAGACGGTPAADPGAANDNAAGNGVALPSEFTGVIEEITDESWLVSSIQVLIRDDSGLLGIFAVGDTVKLTLLAENGDLYVVRAEETEALGSSNANENNNANENSNTNANLNGNANGNLNVNGSNANSNGNQDGNSNSNSNTNSNSNSNSSSDSDNNSNGNSNSDSDDDDD